MKRSIAFFGLVLGAVTVLSAQSISLTNTFGGNSDNVGTSDFLKFDDDSDKPDVVVGDRIQLDLASNKIDSRVRLNIKGDTNFSNAIQGYVNFRPVQPVNLIGGNKFFWKWSTAGAYLAAIDDILNHGKLADDNGGGLVINIAPADSKLSFTAAGAVGAQSRLDLNFGAQFAVKDLFTIGATAQDVTTSAYSLGGYFALNAVKNLLLNIGYTYNLTDGSYIQGTQHVAQVSVGYTIEQIGLSLYADLLTGFNNNSNYDEDTEEYNDLDSGFPLYGAFRANYKLNETIDLNGSVKVNHVLAEDDNVTTVTVYPYFDYKTKYGTFRSGVRVFFDDDTGYKGLNVPFSWQVKLPLKQ